MTSQQHAPRCGSQHQTRERRPTDRGATAIEYGLMIGLIAVVVLAAVSFLGRQTSENMMAVDDTLAGSSRQADAAATAVALTQEAGGADTEGTTTAGTTTADTGSSGTPGADTSGTTERTSVPSATALTAADWRQVAGARGTATLSGTSILTTPGSAAIVMNTTAWGGSDMTLSTTAQLVRPDAKAKDGGYGLWVRATTNQYGQIESGYSYQVDPGLGNKLAIKVWNNRRESSPIAFVHFPSGFDPAAADTRVSVSVIGNRLVATLNGAEVLTIEDLSATVAKLPPLVISGTTYVSTWTAPTGTGYGLRTWGSTGIDATETTIR